MECLKINYILTWLLAIFPDHTYGQYYDCNLYVGYLNLLLDYLFLLLHYGKVQLWYSGRYLIQMWVKGHVKSVIKMSV